MTNPTPHGQVPEALRLAHIFDNPLPPEWPDMVAAAAELRRQHTRIAELEAQIEALSGVQALSAAPAGFVPVAAFDRLHAHAESLAARLLAASPTPPAEQQAAPKAAPAWADQAVIEYRYTGGTHWCPLGPAERMKPDFDGVYRLQGGVFPVEQAAPEAAPGEPSADSLRHQNKLLAEALGACIIASGIVRKDVDGFSGPELLHFAADLQSMLEAAPQQEAQEPTTVDKKTMELAESVGLIGPASRVGDLHAAIQRFHDLICVNATIKAAVMAAEAIGKQQAAPQQEAQDATVAAFEAVRKKLCTLPRYSFVLDDDGLVRRAPDRTGNWIEFDEAHALFDTVSVDAALAAQGGKA